MVTVKVEIEKKLDLPKVDSVHSNCLSSSSVKCDAIECENCLFYFDNYKTLLEQQKGD